MEGGRPNGSRRRALRALTRYLEKSAVPIRGLLLADVLADLLQLELDGGHGVAACPEVLSGEVPLLAAQPGDCIGTLPLQKLDHRSDRVLGWNRDTHMHMVWHQVSLNNLTLFLLGERMKDRPELLADGAENRFPPSLRDEHNMIFAVPFRMG